MNIKLITRKTELTNTIKLESSFPEYFFMMGIEIGAIESFFSLENLSLGNAIINNCNLVSNDTSWKFDASVDFKKANIQISEQCTVDDFGGERTLSITALQKSLLMDSVIRFVIPKNQIKEAKIRNLILKHERRNKYHQFQSTNVELTLNNGAILKFTPFEMNLPKGFSAVVYLRDEPDYWILHYRALALYPSEFSLKGCISWFNRPFPIWFQKFIFNTFPSIRQKLLYIRERISQRIPIQVNGASSIEQGGVIKMSVRWEVCNES